MITAHQDVSCDARLPARSRVLCRRAHDRHAGEHGSVQAECLRLV